MSDSRITTLVRGDGALARVTIEQAGNVLATVEMDVDAVEEALIALSNARAALQPAVSLELLPNDRIGMLADPAWKIEGRTVMGMRAVSFRHPGFGWLSFGLPKSTADSLAEWLVVEVPDTPPDATI